MLLISTVYVVHIISLFFVSSDLVIPVVVSFTKYWRPMRNKDVMRVSAIVSDIDNSSNVYLAQRDLVLADPPMEIKVCLRPKQHALTSNKLNTYSR